MDMDNISSITKQDGKVILNLNDGSKVPLEGYASNPFKLNIKICSFCGLPSSAPLFTTDKKHYICKDCVVLAAETLMENGVALEFKSWNKLFGSED